MVILARFAIEKSDPHRPRLILKVLPLTNHPQPIAAALQNPCKKQELSHSVDATSECHPRFGQLTPQWKTPKYFFSLEYVSRLTDNDQIVTL
jgi:hypothetical protein